MDFTILLGVIAAVGIIAYGVGIEAFVDLFLDFDSIALVLGGTLAAVLIHFSSTQFIKSIFLFKVLFSMRKYNYQKDIDFICELAKKVKQSGPSSIVDDIGRTKDHYLKTGLQLVIDEVSADDVEYILRENIDNIFRRHSLGFNFFTQMAKYSPSFGLLGTVIGLIKLLAELDDPDKVGPGMSIALLTTFYGIFFANLVFTPMAGRLRTYSMEEMFQKEMLCVGIVSLARNDPSFIIKEKMLLYLSDRDRKKMLKKA